MTYYGENVGSEGNGKGEQLYRPVIILKKLNSEIFLCVSTSSVVKPEKSYCDSYRHSGIVYSSMISHVRMLDAKRYVYKGVLSSVFCVNCQSTLHPINLL